MEVLLPSVSSTEFADDSP